MTADERLSLIRVKVERAKKHIADLDRETLAYLASNPYEVRPKEDPQTGKPIFYLAKCEPMSIHLSAIIGDAVHNLRSSLDHLAQQLFTVATGSTSSGTHIHFPIDSSAAQYKANAPGKVKGLRKDAIDAINSIEPYDGGKGRDLWVLNHLDRIDKHRLLVTVNSAYFEDLPLKALVRMIPRWPTDAPVPEGSFRAAEPSIYDLKAGDELPVHPSYYPKVGEKVYFRFNVTLHESGVIERKPLLPTLQQMADLVDNLILTFKLLLA
ncbi:MAG: hypothetical protein ACHQ7N_15415 [Candidatus Methylomirabilales bacterium]